MSTFKIEKVVRNKQDMFIDWSHPDKGYGTLTVMYSGSGRFEIQSEYMSLESVLEILKLINIK